MTLFLNYNLQSESEILTSCWSNTDIPVLAASTSDKRITFYQDEAINLTEHDLKKSGRVTAIGWHPSDMVLSYGLENGESIKRHHRRLGRRGQQRDRRKRPPLQRNHSNSFQQRGHSRYFR